MLQCFKKNSFNFTIKTILKHVKFQSIISVETKNIYHVKFD